MDFGSTRSTIISFVLLGLGAILGKQIAEQLYKKTFEKDFLKLQQLLESFAAQEENAPRVHRGGNWDSYRVEQT